MTVAPAGVADGALLLPGDRALLFLQANGSGGYVIQSISGWHAVVGGVVHPHALNPWARSVDGETEAVFIQQVKQAAAAH
jgi:hypothetical protein